MSSVLLFFVFVIISGYLAVEVIDGSRPSLNFLEKLGMSFGLGLGINSVVIILLTLLTIQSSKEVLVISFCIQIILFLGILSSRPAKERLKEIKLKNLWPIIKYRYDFIELILLIIICLLVLSRFYRALGTPFNTWDEFSYWGIAAKAIYISKSALIKGFIDGGFEKYPLFLPISSASVNIFLDKFAENYSRLINPALFVSLGVFIAGLLKRLGLSFKEILLMLIVFFTGGHIVSEMASILYADMTFAYFYGIAIAVYLLNYLDKQRESNYILTGLFLSLAAWTKIEGLQIALFTVFAIAAFEVINKRGKLKKFFILFLSTILIPALWYIFGIINNLGQAGWTNGLFKNTAYAVAHIGDLVVNMCKISVNNEFWSCFWILVVFSAVFTLLFLKITFHPFLFY